MSRLEIDPDSSYFGMKLNRNKDGRVVLAFGDIAAKKGDRVRYLGENGHEWQRKKAADKGIKKGDILIVSRLLVGTSSSEYWFEGFGDGFNDGWNTVMFKLIRPRKKRQMQEAS